MKTLISMTLLLLAGSASFAAADTFFTLSDVQERDGIVELGTISSDSDGIVQIYSMDGGAKGALLGYEALRAGANSDTKVPLASTPRNSALAELLVNGEVVATQRIRFVD
ncbi:MAG TPA: hypothetical protein VM899_14930 [Rubellimicrobium sp.]|jgi:hypothetical protein|nr:hypothetical protein [Rubellimicrobium sp.]